MTVRRVRRSRRTLAALAALTALAACSDGATAGDAPPFEVGPVPAGYELFVAGEGTERQMWGDDSEGSLEPFTVLAPAGESATSERAVLISATGFAGYQGGLSQASAGYISDESQSFEIDGDPAIYVPAGVDVGGRSRPADLVVRRGDDYAIRVTTREASRAELVAVARSASSRPRHEAPEVEDPPNRLQRIGSVDAATLAALGPNAYRGSDVVPGLPGTRSITWLKGDRASLAVMTLPGDAADLSALPAMRLLRQYSEQQVVPVMVGDQEAMALRTDPGAGSYLDAIVERLPSGALAVASASVLEALPSDVLPRLAASVRETSDAEWEAFVRETLEPAAPQPDPGAIEIERGTFDDGSLEWLLQARPAGSLFEPPVEAPTGLARFVPDPCLKLSNHQIACTNSGSSNGTRTEVVDYLTQADGRPGFVIVTTEIPGATVQIQTRDQTVEAVLHPLPGGAYTGIAFVDRPGINGCVSPTDPTVPANLDVMRVQILDPNGAPLGCIGIGPGT